MPRLMATGSEAASWSVASISMSHLIVSIGGPLSRRISLRSGSSPTACGLSDRVSVSGLYCSVMVPGGMPVTGSRDMMAPCRTSGDTLDMAVLLAGAFRAAWRCALGGEVGAQGGGDAAGGFLGRRPGAQDAGVQAA